MRAVAIIVAYMAGDELHDALTAYHQHHMPVILVENGGAVGAPTIGVDLHVTGHGNVGYGVGLNIGYRAAQQKYGDVDWVLLANADAVPSGHLLRAVLEDDLPAGLDLVGFQDPTGTDAWRRPMPSARASIATALRRDQALLERLPVEKTYAVGALLAVRGRVFRDLDGFDPRYFLYFEEVDFIERAVHAGYRFGFAAPPLTYHHRAHSSTERMGSERWREIGRAGAIHLRNGRKARLMPWLLTEVARLAAQGLKARVTGNLQSGLEAMTTLRGLLTGLIAPAVAERKSQEVFGWRSEARAAGRPARDRHGPPRELVIVAPYVPYEGIDHAGGDYLLRYARAMAGLGWSVSVLVPATRSNLAALNSREPEALFSVSTFAIRQLPGRCVELLWTLLRVRTSAPRSSDRSLVSSLRSADVLDLQWYEIYGRAARFRALAPHAVLIVTMYDLMAQSVRRSARRGRVLERAQSMLALPAVRRRERAALDQCDRAAVFKPADGAYLTASGRREAVTVLPPYVEIPTVIPAPVATSANLVFAAAFWRDENHEAALWFLDEIWPLVLAAHPAAKLFLAGAGPRQALKARAAPNVVVTGYLESLADAYHGMCCAVAPLLRGAGIKFKVVQALRYGFPIVGTSVAFEGIDDLLPSFNAPPADDPQAFASEVNTVLADPVAAIERAARVSLELADAVDFSAGMARLDAEYRAAFQRRRLASS